MSPKNSAFVFDTNGCLKGLKFGEITGGIYI